MIFALPVPINKCNERETWEVCNLVGDIVINNFTTFTHTEVNNHFSIYHTETKIKMLIFVNIPENWRKSRSQFFSLRLHRVEEYLFIFFELANQRAWNELFTCCRYLLLPSIWSNNWHSDTSSRNHGDIQRPLIKINVPRLICSTFYQTTNKVY